MVSVTQDFLSYSDLRGDSTDVDHIIDQYLMQKLFYMGNKKRYPFITFLQSVEGGIQTTTGKGKKILWLYGDEEATSIPTSDIYNASGGDAERIIVPAANNDGTFVIDGNYSYLQESTTFEIIGYIQGAIGFANRAFASLRINEGGAEYDSALDETTINFTTIYYRDGGGGTDNELDLEAFNIKSNLNTWDGAIPPGTQRAPSEMFNYIQHQREVVTTGKWQMAEELLSNIDLMNQAMWKMDQILVKANKHLYTTRWKGIRHYNDLDGNTSREAGVGGGAPHFLCPDFAADPIEADVDAGFAAHVGVKGTNMVVPAGTDLTFQHLRQASVHLGRYGTAESSDTKIVFLSPLVYNEVAAALEGTTGMSVNVSDYTFPGTHNIWKLPQFEFGGGRWVFMPDYTMEDIPETVYGFDPLDPTDENSVVNTLKYMLVVDESVIGNRTLATEDGDQNIRMIDRTPPKDNNPTGSTYKRMEIAKGDCLVINLPQACGYIAWGGSAPE